MKNKKNYQISIFIACCILLNLGGKILAAKLSLPVWMDSMGTVLTAYVLGPVCGAIVGVSLNLIYSVLFSPMSLVYAVVSMAIGIMVGIFARKQYLKNLFGILTTSFLVTIVSVILSVPFNYIFFQGKIGNLWGDSVVELLKELKCNDFLAHIIGQFYIDFLDKVITVCVVAAVIQLYRRYKTGRIENMLMAVLVIVICGVVSPDLEVKAEDMDYSTYIRTVYNSDNGLPGGIANDIVQTKDGILWVGTYGGLYRYNGNDFRLMDEFASVKNANCLYTDESGRLWIGTNDSGLSICINEKITNVVAKEDGLPSNSVRSIIQSSMGDYYVGTTDSLAVLRLSGGLMVSACIPEVTYARSLSADTNEHIAAVTDGGELYLVQGTEIMDCAVSKEPDDVYSCCLFDNDGKLYVGTVGNRICIYGVSGSHLEYEGEMLCEGLQNIRSLNLTEEGKIFICGDNGVGFLDQDKQYRLMNMGDFNSSIDHMTTDYQGNLWFTSSRLGLLKLNVSPFADIYSGAGLKEKVVNCVTYWRGRYYFGTDSGLDMVNGSLTQADTDFLTEELKDTRIRCLLVDSKKHLWISTTGKGVYEVDTENKIHVYDGRQGTLGDKFRSVIELEDGTIAAAGDSGITFIREGAVQNVIGAEEGLANPKVLCLLELEDGRLLAGTDGNGIAVIQNGSITDEMRRDSGLGSDVILRLISDTTGEGIFVVTSNGLCYINADGKVKILDNFPYYNNYDMISYKDGTVFVLSSAGIFVTDRETLVNGEEIEYLLLDGKMGLRKALTPNSWNYISEDNQLYLSTDTGVMSMNLDDYDNSVRSYRLMLKSIHADNERITVKRGSTTVIDRDVERIEITPEIINYSVNDPYIKVWLEGFDNKPKIMRQSALSGITYTNLPSGDYVLHLAVLDNKGVKMISESTYRIQKTEEFYDHWWFRLYFVFVFAVFIAYLTWLLFRTQIQKTINMHNREMELARKQIHMGNETILTIAQAVDARDVNTSRHSVRVSEYAVLIAQRLGMSGEECESLRKTALLHDIGKIGIPDSILNKPARLTDEEYEIMKSHVTRGAKILEHFTLIDKVAEGALYHHERYDGKGYVHGLQGEEIPLTARIVGLADAFDAMTANRVYRKQLDMDVVIEELKKGRGTQFDPQLVDILLELIEYRIIDIEKMYQKCEVKS